MNPKQAHVLAALLQNGEIRAALEDAAGAIARSRMESARALLLGEKPAAAHGEACVSKFAEELVLNLQNLVRESLQ
jgi:hypothetical protein